MHALSQVEARRTIARCFLEYWKPWDPDDDEQIEQGRTNDIAHASVGKGHEDLHRNSLVEGTTSPLRYRIVLITIETILGSIQIATLLNMVNFMVTPKSMNFLIISIKTYKLLVIRPSPGMCLHPRRLP